MAVFVWLGIALMVAGVLALAAWSDRRDRRLGIDPKVRAESLGRRREMVREHRVTRRLGRATPNYDDGGRPGGAGATAPSRPEPGPGDVVRRRRRR